MRATYRLQLRESFPMQDAAAITDYLDDLGVSHLYLSPILESRPESNHGYDGTDPTKISEERGGEEGFRRLIKVVERSKGLAGVILDIVPNHVAASWRTPAWWDVLKNGPASIHWTTFDIRPRNARDARIVLPVLGRSRQAIIASRELHFAIYDYAGMPQLVLKYFDNYFPLSARSAPKILRALASDLKDSSVKAAKWKKACLKFAERFEKSSTASVEKAFATWLESDPVAVRVFNVTLKGLPLKVIEATLNEQSYALEDWRAGSREINYRRFFDINDLAAIRVEDERVFKWSHAKIAELIDAHPQIHGLRIDHIDGLTDPQGYLERLAKISNNVWVEKILGDGEKLPRAWPTRGTTGYEYLGSSARLFVDLPGLMHLHSHYTLHVDHRWERFHDCVYDSKREMLDSHFVSELQYLTEQFFALASLGRKRVSFTQDDLRMALRELTASLRVYRTYFDVDISKHGTSNHWLKLAFAEVEGRGRLDKKEAYEWLRATLRSQDDITPERLKVIKRWEQLTGPVMAKGLEDTALYRYFPLLSLNIVGGEPDWSGDGAIEFHAYNQDRLRVQPYTMSTSSTHDTKRSEDVRARIHVISELAEEWTSTFARWHKENAKLRVVGDRQIPEPSLEYMIYETLLGAWPIDQNITPEFSDRMKQYFIKAAREGKSETSWTEPDQTYEDGLKNFVDRILFPKDRAGKKFLKEFESFASRCAYFGALNSLGNLSLKILSPGVPDFYQGTELWDMSLVDPDNRRPVDYDLRRSLLQRMRKSLAKNPADYLKGILKNWKSGEVKLWLTAELLRLRKSDPLLFTEGDYFAIEPTGEARRHFVSFMRRIENRWMMVVIPRFLASREDAGAHLGIRDAKILATGFSLPPHAPKEWTNALTGRLVTATKFNANLILDGLPIAVLMAED